MLSGSPKTTPGAGLGLTQADLIGPLPKGGEDKPGSLLMVGRRPHAFVA